VDGGGRRGELLFAKSFGVEGGEGVDEGEGVTEEGYESSSDVEVDELGEVVAKEGEDGGEGGFSDVEEELPFGFSSSSGRGVLRRGFG